MFPRKQLVDNFKAGTVVMGLLQRERSRAQVAACYQIQNSRSQPESTTLIPKDMANTANTLRPVALA